MWYRSCLRTLILAVFCLGTLTACAIPRVTAEQRTFMDLSLEWIGEYRLPKQSFEGSPVGGLSAITYDRPRDRFYALSDDRSEQGPARFYTLKFEFTKTLEPDAAPQQAAKPIKSVQIERVTTLKGPDHQPYAKGTIDPEGIVLTPQRTLLISSEGLARSGVPPFINEFDLQTGTWLRRLPIPKYYLPGTLDNGKVIGVQDNLGFEALTSNPVGSVSDPREPLRVFAATESALAQDQELATELGATPSRILHYLLGDGPPLLISEHLYPVEPKPADAELNGLTELLAIDQGGHFLSLERFYGNQSGLGAKIYQVAMGGATDISGMNTLEGKLAGIQPAKKKLLLDITKLDIRPENLEGMTIGPRLPDGSDSLIVIADNNFSSIQVNQILLFRLTGLRKS